MFNKSTSVIVGWNIQPMSHVVLCGLTFQPLLDKSCPISGQALSQCYSNLTQAQVTQWTFDQQEPRAMPEVIHNNRLKSYRSELSVGKSPPSGQLHQQTAKVPRCLLHSENADPMFTVVHPYKSAVWFWLELSHRYFITMGINTATGSSSDLSPVVQPVTEVRNS